MTSRPLPRLRRLLFCALALGLMPGSNAEAAKATRKRAAPAGTPHLESCRGGNLFACGPVHNGNDYLGTDPDPFIRLQIQRDLGAKYSSAD